MAYSSPPGRYCSNRLFEWTMTFTLIGLGVHLIIWPGAVAASKFQFMLDMIGSQTLMLAYLIIGILRATALFLNGNWPVWGPLVRAYTSLGGALVWFQMDASLYLAQRAINADPSPSLWLYTALVGAELYSTYRAAADARYR
jgi:hypothetical protein